MADRMLRLICGECDLEFIVPEQQVADLPLTCPCCAALIDVHEEDEGEGNRRDTERGEEDDEDGLDELDEEEDT